MIIRKIRCSAKGAQEAGMKTVVSWLLAQYIPFQCSFYNCIWKRVFHDRLNQRSTMHISLSQTWGNISVKNVTLFKMECFKSIGHHGTSFWKCYLFTTLKNATREKSVLCCSKSWKGPANENCCYVEWNA